MYITKKLWLVAKRYCKKIFAMSIWTTIPVLFDVAQMLCCSFLLIVLLNEGSATDITFTLLGVFCCFILKRAGEHILIWKKSYYGNLFKSEFREELFRKLFLLGPALIDKKQNGELINTLWERVEWIYFYFFYYIPTSIMTGVISLVCCLLWLSVQPLIGVIILLGGFFVMAAPPLFHRFLEKGSRDEWDGNDAFYSTCLDGIQGITTLKAFHANDRHRAKVDEMSEENRRRTMSNLLYTTLNSRLIELIISICEVVIIAVGTVYFANGIITAYHLISLYFVVQAWASGSSRLLGAWLRGNKGVAAYEKAFEILDAECSCSLTQLNSNDTGNSTDENKHTYSDEDMGGDIEFENVTFTYSAADRPAVNDVSFSVKQGTQTALAGASGSGKSTIVQLLFGFYRPQIGTIKIGGQILGPDNVRSFQNEITVIWQNCHIFHMSCFDNIKIARPDASDEEVYAAARNANIHDMILQLPEGYHTVIGDGGRVFSGGEKQRVAIARAFLRNTPILIFDEATSSLDRKNEIEIEECFRDLCKGKTVITIAHRLDSIQSADQICVMEKGCLVECGTHQELMRAGTRYSEFIAAGYRGECEGGQ